MNNLPFAIWMVGFPISRALEQGVDKSIGNTYSLGIQYAAALATVSVWFLVGKMLYRREEAAK